MQSTKQPTQEKIDIATIKRRWNKLKELKNPGQSMNEILQADLDDDSSPVSPAPNIKTNDVAYMVINRNDISTA